VNIWGGGFALAHVERSATWRDGRRLAPTHERERSLAERVGFGAGRDVQRTSRQTGRPLEPPPTERQRRKVAERVGFFEPASRNPNRHGLFQRNSHNASSLAFANSVAGSYRFASICGFCQRNDTRNDTRRNRLRGSSSMICAQTFQRCFAP
jgi:hypothetical protein